VAWFSIDEGQFCSQTITCKPGLECYNEKCVKPSYHLLLGPYGAVWGPDCDPMLDGPGCTCNYVSKSYQFLKERSIVFKQACADQSKNLDKCMNEKGCTNLNEGYQSCMRRNCYDIYKNWERDCTSDETLWKPRCSGSSLSVLIGLIVLVLLFV
jgi:hypothetical protein